MTYQNRKSVQKLCG